MNLLPNKPVTLFMVTLIISSFQITTSTNSTLADTKISHKLDRVENTAFTDNSNIFTLAAPEKILRNKFIAQSNCDSVPHAMDEYRALNNFWKTNIPICRIYNVNNAYAERSSGVVFADQDWLDQMASKYGNYAATGILAHEWGHMVQGNVSGTAAELQADCLAGVFMKGFGLPWQTVEQFARANWDSTSSHWSIDGHGTKTQRVIAARQGYYGYRGQRGSRLVALCPLSAF
jgi:hypothetical protein